MPEWYWLISLFFCAQILPKQWPEVCLRHQWTLLSLFILSTACGKFEAITSPGKNKQSATAVCTHKLTGGGGFGRASFGCAMAPELASSLYHNYQNLTFNEKQSTTTENKRFVEEMHAFITEFATAYLKRREPEATDEDMENWRQLILATAHQESFWTQYRLGKDGLFRFLRGDGGHGYGMMQVDDRWHKEFISSKKVFDLEQHMIYTLDMLYDTRKDVLGKPCGGEQTGEAINRSIYSAYNGGPRSKCRWQQSSRWSQNDIGFYEKLSGKRWEKEL